MITAPGRNLNVELLTAGEALAAMVFLGVAQKVVSKSMLRSLCIHMVGRLIQT